MRPKIEYVALHGVNCFFKSVSSICDWERVGNNCKKWDLHIHIMLSKLGTQFLEDLQVLFQHTWVLDPYM